MPYTLIINITDNTFPLLATTASKLHNFYIFYFLRTPCLTHLPLYSQKSTTFQFFSKLPIHVYAGTINTLHNLFRCCTTMIPLNNASTIQQFLPVNGQWQQNDWLPLITQPIKRLQSKIRNTLIGHKSQSVLYFTLWFSSGSPTSQVTTVAPNNTPPLYYLFPYV